MHSYPDSDYDDKMKVMVAGNADTVDVLYVRTPLGVIEYAKNNALVDLAPYLSASNISTAPITEFLSVISIANGKYYALPTRKQSWMLFYNKDLFDAAGIPYPVNLTWDQYLDLAQRLTHTDNGVKYWGGVDPMWHMAIGASGASEYLTIPTLNRIKTYAEGLYRRTVTDKSHPDIAAVKATNFDIYNFFGEGHTYMMINGTWSLDLVKAGFTMGVAPMPIFPGLKAGSTMGQAAYYTIPANSRHKEEAWKFLQFCAASIEGSKILAETKYIAAYPTDEAVATFKSVVSNPGTEYLFSAVLSPETGFEPYYGDISNVWNQELELYLLGEQSMETTLSNFYKMRDDIIKNY
jgi:ABC-type glycerol-3-phosphate transport system substrate-binding protein